jgi:hypothetical protein
MFYRIWNYNDINDILNFDVHSHYTKKKFQEHHKGHILGTFWLGTLLKQIEVFVYIYIIFINTLNGILLDFLIW